MAITLKEQEQIFNLIIGMFNASPGKNHLDSISRTYETLNNDISLLAQSLAQSTTFTNQFANMNNSLISEVILDNFNMTPTTTEGKVANTYVMHHLENGKTKEEIILSIIDYLTDDNRRSDIFDSVYETLKNKLEVAKYHSLVLQQSSSKISELKDVLNGLTSLDSTVDQAIEKLSTSKEATIKSITIPDGNYTYGAEINITVAFNDNISIDNTDITLKLELEDVKKDAKLSSFTDDTLTFKYIVEDGYFSKDATVTVSSNGLVLNNTKILDKDGLKADIKFSSVENSLAVISDQNPPSYVITNTHYDSNSNTFIINGEGFNTILEYNENSSLDVSDRIDLTKLVWDFDSDDNGTTNTVLQFTSKDIVSIKALSDNKLAFVLSNDINLEDNVNFNLNNGIDSIDILEGFLLDTAKNVSKVMTLNDVILSIDNIFSGTNSSDTIYATPNDDIISTLQGNDVIYGQNGNDTINAGDGNDIINGGLGIDNLTGGNGQDTFVFSKNDSLPFFNTSIGVDIITDLNLNGNNEDLIDLDVKISQVNSEVIGSVNKLTFIQDMDNLLSVVNRGFNKSLINDISASIVNVNSGDLQNKNYLAVDYNANDMFDKNDFIIEITGSNITNFTVDSIV